MTKTDAYQAGYDHGFMELVVHGLRDGQEDVPNHVPDERVADYATGYIAGILACWSAQKDEES